MKTWLWVVFASLVLANISQAQVTDVRVENIHVYGQDHGFPHGFWPGNTLGTYFQTIGDFDGNGVSDVLIDTFGYTIVLLKSDGTVDRMLPGHADIEGVIGPGDLNKDGIPDIAYLRAGKVYLGFLDSDGWVTSEEQLVLQKNDTGIGVGFTTDKLHRVGDVDEDGTVDIGISMQSNTSDDLRDRRFGVVYVDLTDSQNRKGEQYVDWTRGEWMTGDPGEGKQIDLAVGVLDLQAPADGRKDFILLSSNQNDEIVTNYIDFNADGSANHYLGTEMLDELTRFSTTTYLRVFDEPNPASGDFRFRCICYRNRLITLDSDDKTIVSDEDQGLMVVDGSGFVDGRGDVAQISDITNDGKRDYVSGNDYEAFFDGGRPYMQTWSENNGQGLVVNSDQNGGWKMIRPGDQYGSAISVIPRQNISNSFTQHQLIGVRAREDGRGSFMWQHHWHDTGQGDRANFYVADTEFYSLESRDLFGSSADATLGFVGAPGRNGDTGAIFKIPGVNGSVFASARYIEPENVFEVDLGAPLNSELSPGDEFGSSVDGIVNADFQYDVAVGAIEKNQPGGKNTGAVYLLDIEDGSVVSYKEIGRNTPMLSSRLDDIDHFGSGLAFIGDLDGNGISELAVGARVDDDGGNDRGAVYILFLDEEGEVISLQKISSTQGGFGGLLPNSSFFGEAVARLGDVNNDGISDIAVGSPRLGNGALWILTLNADGTVKTTSKIDDAVEGIEYDDGALFGGAVDAHDCFPVDPLSDIGCFEDSQVWVSARGDNEHRGTVWAFDIELGTDTTIPVELTSFSGIVDQKSAVLSWEVASELNNAGFSIEKSFSREIGFEEIGFVRGAGTSLEQRKYSYIDADLSHVGKIYYRLKQIDFDGSFEYSDVVELTHFSVDKVILHSNYPNPFNPSTTIRFDLATEGQVRLSIHDLMGREVNVLVDQNLNAGQHVIEFDGNGLASGIYVYRLTTKSLILSRKMLLLK